MGRRRKVNKHLPERMQHKHGAYYFLARSEARQKWLRLSDDYGEALRAYSELVGSRQSVRTIEEALNHYLLARQAELKPDTLAGYHRSSRSLCPVFGHMALADLRRDHVYNYLRKKGNVAANRDKALLSAMYTHMINTGMFCGPNPCMGLHYRNRERPRNRYITDEEMTILIKGLPRKLSLMARWSYATGMRESNTLGLMLTAAGEVGVTYTPIKGRKGEMREPVTIRWSEELLAIWHEAAGSRVGAVPLFPNKHREPFTRDQFQSLWRYWRAKLGLKDLRWHDLRRKTGSDARGVEEAAELLAHSDDRVTRRHYRAKPKVIEPLK